jgi:general nucleoside transport system ATP-binding protein
VNVELEGIVKRFGALVANDGASMRVESGTVHALVGENGAGKSTLMNVLYGMTRPDSGRITIDGETVVIRSPLDAIGRHIGMVHQDFLLIPRFSVAENIALGRPDVSAPRWRWRSEVPEVTRRIEELSDRYGLDVDPQVRVSELSVGAQQRVEIMKLLVRNTRTLILDEPSGVLTPHEADALFEVIRHLATGDRSVIVITHKLHEIFRFTDNVTVMRAGRDVLHTSIVDTDPDQLAHAMVGERSVVTVNRIPGPDAAPLLALSEVSYCDPRGVQRLCDIDLAVHAGEIVGVAGVDGNGQSELAELVAGLLPLTTGRMEIDGVDAAGLGVTERRRRGLGYVPADRRGVGSVHEFSIADNTALGRLHRFRRRLARFDRHHLTDEAATLMTDYDVRAPGPHFAAGQLSGGNLQKLIVGRELADQPLVIVFEQPTRGLDLRATDAVRQTIVAARDRGAAILLISADLDEVTLLADRVVVLFEGRIVGERHCDRFDTDDLGLLMAGIAP